MQGVAPRTGGSEGLPRGYIRLWGRVWGAGLGVAHGGGRVAGGGECSGGKSSGSSSEGDVGGVAVLPADVEVVELQQRLDREPGVGFGPPPELELHLPGRSGCGRVVV